MNHGSTLGCKSDGFGTVAWDCLHLGFWGQVATKPEQSQAQAYLVALGKCFSRPKETTLELCTFLGPAPLQLARACNLVSRVHAKGTKQTSHTAALHYGSLVRIRQGTTEPLPREPTFWCLGATSLSRLVLTAKSASAAASLEGQPGPKSCFGSRPYPSPETLF